MLNYLNGVILGNLIRGEQVLFILLDPAEGHPFLHDLPQIIKSYDKYVSCICLKDFEQEQAAIMEAFKIAQNKNLKTCLISDALPDISKKLSRYIDYVLTNDNLYKKDYSPFGDAEDWIEMSNLVGHSRIAVMGR